MKSVWRILFLSGIISVFTGILYITSVIEAESSGLNVWGYFLLFWGIFVIMTVFNRLYKSWIIKGLASIGILLHGSLAFFWLLFPGIIETKEAGSITILYASASIMVTFFSMYIIGKKVRNNPSKL
ncbi:hypothetical protein KUV80_07130 [Fictibacillus nanhaiensis]|uniref:hypothetical protein n=1 Tax=Fictibacillus nanhaiensis TaxID=742169 RepID=UPI001C9592AD|nr:hypothetical protein [Fictibacillus nanhaiensis]MBY6036419.1 hypothetical protein [Fictibacillus nanhaiensis]